MQYGFIIPGGADVRAIAELAHHAEDAGWDGVFIPDCIAIDTPDNPPAPCFDPWVTLAAMAIRTERVRLGTMLTAIARRRPWKLAHEAVTLDHLSRGRLILAIGLGAATDDTGFYRVGEAMDRKTRAERMDEGLDILTGLWRGEPFSYQGTHYQIDHLTLLPPPVQQPRIPIWVVGAWPRPKSMQRALRYDGLLPAKVNPDGSAGEVTPDDIRAMLAFSADHRTLATPLDIIWEGRTPGDDLVAAHAQIQPFIDAGATWWMETMWTAPNSLDDIRERIAQGPPLIGCA